MLKKPGYIMLVALLILTTAGFGMSKSICNNKLVSISIDNPATSCCNTKENHCCHNKSVTLILQVNFTKPSVDDETRILAHDLFGITLAERVNEYPRETTLPGVLPVSIPPPGTHLFLSKIQTYLL